MVCGFQIHSRYVQDASYLKLKNLTIGYTLPRNLTDLPAVGKRCEVRMYGQDGKFCALYSYDPRKDELRNVKMFIGGEE